MPKAFPVLRDGIRQLAVTLGLGKNYYIPAADNEPERCTYGYGVLGLVTVASPTDILQIANPTGSNRIIRVKGIVINGLNGTTSNYGVRLLRRTTANTGGTPTVVVGFYHDSTDPAPVAVVTAFAANPNLGNTDGTGHVGRLVAANASNLDRMAFQWGWQNDKVIILQPGETLAINLGGAGNAGSNLDIDIETCEEHIQS
jgi:hypothetical protein